MADLPAWLGTVSPIGALIAFILLVGIAIVRGYLVPRSTVDFMRAMHDERLRDKTEEAAAERLARTTQQEIAAEQAEQLAALGQQVDVIASGQEAIAEGQETIVQVVEALRRAAGLDPEQTS